MTRLLLFDFDGTLADTRETFTVAFSASCHEHGLSQFDSPEAFGDLFDGNLVEQMLAAGVSDDQMDAFLATLGDRNLAYRDTTRLFAGIDKALEQLAKTHTVGVVTSNLTDPVAAVLAAHGLGFIDRIVGSEIEPSKAKKIRQATADVGATECFYVGDTCGDILEARAAGAVSVAVSWGWHDRDRLAGVSPDHLVDTPEQLVTLLLE